MGVAPRDSAPSDFRPLRQLQPRLVQIPRNWVPFPQTITRPGEGLPPPCRFADNPRNSSFAGIPKLREDAVGHQTADVRERAADQRAPKLVPSMQMVGPNFTPGLRGIMVPDGYDWRTVPKSAFESVSGNSSERCGKCSTARRVFFLKGSAIRARQSLCSG